MGARSNIVDRRHRYIGKAEDLACWPWAGAHLIERFRLRRQSPLNPTRCDVGIQRMIELNEIVKIYEIHRRRVIKLDLDPDGQA